MQRILKEKSTKTDFPAAFHYFGFDKYPFLLPVSRCSSGNKLMPPFVAQGSAGAAALTASFPAFKFNGYDTVYFECVIDFCYRDNDLACQGVRLSIFKGKGEKGRREEGSTKEHHF